MIMLFRVFIFFFIGIPLVYACEDKDGKFVECDYRQYGHRRALLKEPLVEVKTADGRVVSHSYQDYFERIAEQANELRQHLMKTEAFGSKTTGDNEDIQSKARNIASFGFVFFDQNGEKINRNPFHFFSGKFHGTVGMPFFFLSGRCHKGYQESDPYYWTALPESAPKQVDLRLMPCKTHVIQQSLSSAVTDLHLREITRIHECFEQSIADALCVKAIQEPFFDYVYTRSPFKQKGITIKPRAIKMQFVCGALLSSITLPGVQVESSNKEMFANSSETSKSSGRKIAVIYPGTQERNDKENTAVIGSKEKKEGNKEKDFTHSEQYALFQASQSFEGFLDSCVERIGQTKAPEQIVASYAVLIYTYNTMCIRCAQSIFIDFVRTDGDKSPTDGSKKTDYESFNQTINRKLDKLTSNLSIQTEPKGRDMVFMSGYTNHYKSDLYDIPSDEFEMWVRQQTGDTAEKETLKSDITRYDSQKKEYTSCSPQTTPEMIYHTRITNGPALL